MTEPRLGVGSGPVVVAGLGTFKGLCREHSSPHSSEQGTPVLSHPIRAGERGQLLLNCFSFQRPGWSVAGSQRRVGSPSPHRTGRMGLSCIPACHVPHAASACVCPQGLVVSPDLLAAGGCSKLLPVVEVFLERAGKIACPCPGWLVQSSVCLILTEQCPGCHPAAHEGTGRRGAGDHPADGGKEAPGLPEEGAAGGVTTSISIPASLEPLPCGAVLPTPLAAAKASVLPTLLPMRGHGMGCFFSRDFLLLQQALTLYPVWMGSWMRAVGKSAKQKGTGLQAEVLCDPRWEQSLLMAGKVSAPQPAWGCTAPLRAVCTAEVWFGEG